MRNRVGVALAAVVVGGVMAVSSGVASAAVTAPASVRFAAPPTGTAAAAPAAAAPSGTVATTPSPAASKAVADCSRSVGADGFARANVTGAALWTGTITFTRPCIVQLADGATLRIANAALQSDKLYITELQPAGPRSGVEILNSTLSGTTDGGFQIRLAHAASSATIANSKLTYALSIGASIGAVADSAARLEVANSQLTSTDARSEGVVLVSTGRGVFTNDRFAVNAAQESALVYGETCVQANNVGANAKCSDS